MGKREYFPAFFSYKRTLKGLSDEQMGRVFRAALEYAETGEEPDLDPLEMMGFAFMKEDIDRANTSYTELCETRKANGSKGGRPTPEKPNGFEKNQMVSEKPNGFCEDEKNQMVISETKKTYREGKGERKANANEKSNVPTAQCARKKIPPDVEEVRAYIREHGYHVDAEKFMDYHERQGWKLSNGIPMKDWQATIRTWEARNREKSPPKQDPMQSSFDTDEYMVTALLRTYGPKQEETEEDNG